MVEITKYKNHYYIKAEIARSLAFQHTHIDKGYFIYTESIIKKIIENFLLLDVNFSVRKSIIY